MAMTAAEAEALGFIVNRHAYPWVAYKGPTFDPIELFRIETPSWPEEQS